MTLDRDGAVASGDTPPALKRALKQSHVVKAKVEACADDLAAANEIVKDRIAQGVTLVSAHVALEDSESVEAKVQECADDLTGVTESLAQGIGGLRQTEIALAESQTALAQSEEALATARDGEREATQRALHDATTGLPNRHLFDDRLEQAISLAQRQGWTLAVMFLDLDRFKAINDTHGHADGDLVLNEVARRLSRHARVEDTVCRNGGDEFLFLLVNPQGGENIDRMARLVLKAIAEPIEGTGSPLFVTASIGISLYPDHGSRGDELVRNADAAMYRAKKRRSGCALFNPLEDASQTNPGPPAGAPC